MTHIPVISFTIASVLVGGLSYARDVQVDGYYRRDGSYVQPYTRSAPDSSRANNYGSAPSNSGWGSGYSSPYTRDTDRDGISNQYDYDDDNYGVGDDRE